jgi:CheY-like chemotaxis protein
MTTDILETLKGLNVLAVDDNRSSLLVLSNILHDMGITQVFTAKDGMEALEFISAFDNLDVILCDWKMPKVSGIDVLKQVRTCDPNIPFLMVTGLADEQSVLEAKLYNVTGYVRKPYASEQLQKKMYAIARVIEHRKAS